MQGSVRRLNGGIGATLRSVLRLAGHDLGERESEQRRGVWLGVTSWGWLGKVRKRVDSEREREQRLRMRGVKWSRTRGRRTRVLENGLRKNFP